MIIPITVKGETKMKTIFFALIMSLFSCNKEAPPAQTNVWLMVKAQNVQVVTPTATYREIVFDFTISSDSQHQQFLNMPLPMSVVVEYKSVKYPFELPANEATIRLGKNLIVTDTIQPTDYKITDATYPIPSIKINY